MNVYIYSFPVPYSISQNTRLIGIEIKSGWLVNGGGGIFGGDERKRSKIL